MDYSKKGALRDTHFLLPRESQDEAGIAMHMLDEAEGREMITVKENVKMGLGNMVSVKLD